MKFLSSLIALVIFIILCSLSILMANDYIHSNQFKQIKQGMNISDCREILGNPDQSMLFENDIIDVYYYFPIGEARFFYSKNEKVLQRSWKTDFD